MKIFVYNFDQIALFKTLNDLANVISICIFKIRELCINKTKEIKCVNR